MNIFSNAKQTQIDKINGNMLYKSLMKEKPVALFKKKKISSNEDACTMSIAEIAPIIP